MKCDEPRSEKSVTGQLKRPCVAISSGARLSQNAKREGAIPGMSHARLPQANHTNALSSLDIERHDPILSVEL
jgi:hypothetical protein